MGDGMWVVSFSSFLTDNPADPEFMIPPMRSIPFYAYVYYYSLYPLWIILGYYFSKQVRSDPLQKETPLRKNPKMSTHKNFTISKPYDFDDLRVYKKFDCTFNDFILTHISKVFKKEFEKAGVKAESFVACIPINMKKAPRTFDDV